MQSVGASASSILTNTNSLSNLFESVNNSTGLNEYKSGNFFYSNVKNIWDEYRNNLINYQNNLTNYKSKNGDIKINLLKAIISTSNVAIEGVKAYILSNILSGPSILNALIPISSAFYDSELMKKSGETINDGIGNGIKSLMADGFNMLSNQFLPPTLEQPVPPSQPVATFYETSYSGKIEVEDKYNSMALLVPGSIPSAYLDAQNQSTDPGLSIFTYPSYNETLGLFSLLETPKIQIVTNYWETKDYLHNIQNSPNSAGESKISKVSTTTYLIKLANNVQYKFNQVLDFDIDKTKVYYSIKITFNSTYKIPVMKESHLTDKINLITNNYDYESFETNDYKIKHVITTPFILFKNALNDPYFVSFEYERNKLVNRDNQIIGGEGFEGKFIPNSIAKIELKLMVDMHFKKKGYFNQPLNTVQVFTYKLYENVPLENINEIATNGVIESNGAIFYGENNFDFKLYHQPGNVVFDNIVLSPISVGVYPYHNIIGNEIHIYVENALLKNNISVAPGYVVYIHPLGTAKNSGSSTWVKNLHISPTSIKDIYNYKQPFITESTDANLLNFCASNLYKANKSIYKTAANSNSTVPNNNIKSVANIMCNLYPNPAKEQVSLYFLIPDQLYVQQVKILGLLGNVIEEFLYNANLYTKRGTIVLNLNKYKAGLYFVCLSTNNGQQITQKLIIND